MTLHTTTDTDREHMRDEADRKRVHDALDTLERLADTDGAWTPDEAVAALDAAETAFERTKGSAYEAGAAVALGMISRRVLDVLVSEHKERARLARREGR